MSKLVAVKALFSVSLSAYSEIYSEKIFPLFGQILMTCLNCSRSSFFLSVEENKKKPQCGRERYENQPKNIKQKLVDYTVRKDALL